MAWQFTPYALPVLGAALLCGVITLYTWRQRALPGALFLAGMTAIVSLWSAAYALELMSVALTAKLLWAKVNALGGLIAPLASLLFVLQYSGYGHWVTRRTLAALGVFPALTALLLFTNEFHHWIWLDVQLVQAHSLTVLQFTQGGWFWPYFVYAYGVAATSTLLLIRMIVRGTPHLYRFQAMALLVGVLAPWAGNVLYYLGQNPLPDVDLTPLGFAIGGVALAIGLFRFRLLDIRPIARHAILENMREAVLVVDNQQRVIDLNRAAQNLLRLTPAEVMGQPVAQLLPPLTGSGVSTTQLDIVMGQGANRRDLNLRLSPLTSAQGHTFGQLLVLRDITERKRAEAELRHRDKILAALAYSGELLLRPGPLTASLSAVLEALGQAAEASRATLYQNYMAEDGRLLARPLDRWAAPAAHAQAGPLPEVDYQGWGLTRWINLLSAGRPIVGAVDDFPDAEQAALQRLALHSVASVPIFCQGQWWGFLEFVDDEPARLWSAAEIEALKSAAGMLGAALARQATEAAEREQNRYLTLLNTITRATIETQEFGPLLQTLADHLRELFNADHCFITLWDETHHRPIRAAASGPFRETYVSSLTLAHEGTLSHLVLEAGRALVVEDALHSPLVSASLAERFNTRSVLGLPLIARGQRLGVVFIAFREAHHFSASDIARGEQATQQVALAVAQARLFTAMTVEHSHFQALIESSSDGICLVGLDRRILVINAPALAYLQLPGSPDEWTGQRIRNGLRHLRARAPQAMRDLLEEFRRIETGDEPPGEGELVLPPRTLRWLNLPVRADTTVLGRLLVVRDVTQQHQLSVLRDELTHMMVHDLRSPLSTVSTALEFLDSDVHEQLDNEQQQTLAIARESVRFTLDLVNAILDVHQLESGQIALECLPIPLTHLVVEALRLHTPAAAARGLTLLSDVPEALPPAWADPNLVSRVLQNLVNNAIKFTPPNGRVQVVAMVESSERPHLIVTVRDTGPGIPPHIQNRLFQKFVSERPASGGRRGSGLGLAFCKLVVEAHGGRIWAESQPGKGAQFIFTLPVALPEEGAVVTIE